jgi:hypothetical protein
MHKTVLPAWLAVTGIIVAAATADGAELAAPDLRGTWTGTGPVVGKTEGWIEETVTLVVTEQRGSVFSGRKKYSDGEEAIYRAVSADGSTLLVVDDGDGQAIGKVLGPTSIEYCYAEGGADAQAYCRVLTKG